MTAGRQRATRPHWGRNLAIWAALMGLLLISFGIAYLPLGRIGVAAGIGIAFLKAALVVSFFMELDRASTLIRFALAAGCLFAAVLFGLTFSDILTRP